MNRKVDCDIVLNMCRRTVSYFEPYFIPCTFFQNHCFHLDSTPSLLIIIIEHQPCNKDNILIISVIVLAHPVMKINEQEINVIKCLDLTRILSTLQILISIFSQ